MNTKDQVWYGVMIDNDTTEIEYSSTDLSYIQKKIDRCQKNDSRKGRTHTYTIVTLGTVDNY